MGKNSGRTRNTTSNGRQAITERGYSRRLQRNILARENNIRNNRDESLHYFDASGTELARLQGKGTSVRAPKGFVDPQGAIITHNHPRAIGRVGIMAIGNSFSSTDIMTAVRTDAQEMRVVTPTYTFSMRRPSQGWGATAAQVKKEYSAADRKVKKLMNNYISKQGWSADAINRATVLHWHMVNRMVAKKFGWIYSKKNS